MLGVPTADTPKLRRWSVDLGTYVLIMPSVADRYERANTALGEMKDYFLSLIAHYRGNPSQSGICTLLEYASPSTPEALSDEDIAAAAMLLLFAGHETTTNLITNGMYALLRNPAELKRLSQAPERVESAIEEFLRFESPAQMIVRIAMKDMQVGDQVIRNGERIYAVLQAANRDPAHVAGPDQLDIQRTNTDHMAFGHGMHFCVGAPLARMVAQATFGVLFSRLTDFECIGGEPEWHDALVVRAMKALPIGFRVNGAQS
jgi:cytochrome P450